MLEGTCHCGAITWRMKGFPESITACNCTICRRQGTLWAYGHEGEDLETSGETDQYAWGPKHITFHRCKACGNIGWWRANTVGKTSGRRRMGVNVRLCEPEPLAALPIDHFDGLVKFDDLPRDERCVRDMWF